VRKKGTEGHQAKGKIYGFKMKKGVSDNKRKLEVGHELEKRVALTSHGEETLA